MSALIGTNSSNGLGNVMIGLEYVKREGVEWNDVDFYEKALRDPTTSGTVYIDTDPYINFGATDFTGSATAGSVVDSIFNRAPANTVLRDATGVYRALAQQSVIGRIWVIDKAGTEAAIASFVDLGSSDARRFLSVAHKSP